MTKAITALFLMVLLGASHAAAQEVPGTDSEDTPEIQAEIDAWVAGAETFRAETQDFTHLWQEAADALPQLAQDVYLESANGFVTFTQERSGAIRALAGHHDAACILRGIGLDVTDRIESYSEADGVDGHVAVLTGIERLIYEGLLIFGAEQEARAVTTAPIRASFELKSEKPAATAPPPEDCDAEPMPSK